MVNKININNFIYYFYIINSSDKRGMGFMYLKEVQLENFKSFGRRIKIPFLEGFTAITGPNGSGKSNIADAILFVLGPKSSKIIRAGRLTDLIYKGGKEKVNQCKVSLVFDNKSKRLPITEDEIILTRKIKRAPLPDNPDNYYSYFYINGRTASLSDFIQLLTTGSISANSIVQQGDVTAIVEMGDVPRRKVIDDIAGIAEFDRDIEKAEKEKDEVEKNMEYIDIVLREIKNQLRQLKKDRDGALSYKNLKEELVQAKGMLSYKKKIEIEKELTEVEKQIQSYQKDKEKFEEEYKNLKEIYKKKQITFQGLEEKIAEIGGEEIEDIKEKVNNLREETIKAKEKLNFYTKELLEDKEEKKELNNILQKTIKQLHQQDKQHKDLEQELKKCKNKRKENEKTMEDKKDSITHTDEKTMEITRNLAKLKKEYQEKRTILHELELKKDRLTQKKDALNGSLAEIEEKKNTYEFEIKDIKWQVDELHKEERNKTKEKESLEKNLFKEKKEEAEISELLKKFDKEIIYLQRELSRLRAREDASTYKRATREILKTRDEGKIKGIYGSIAELGEVEETYKKALGIAAGGRVEAIVVENDKVASECITHLKKHEYGRTTFLPLNKMVTGKPRGKALLAVRDEHAHGFAIDLISFNEVYKAAFWYVFGDTIVMDTLEAARNVMGGVRLVTLEGEIIETSGAMTGGSSPKNVIFGAGDRKKLEEIGEKLRNAMHQQEILSERLIAVREDITEIEKNLHGMEIKRDDKAERLNIQRKEFEGKFEVIRNEWEAKKKDMEKLSTEIEKNEEDIKKENQVLIQLEEERERLENNLRKVTRKEILRNIEELKEKIEKNRENERDLLSKIKTLQMENGIIKERKKEIEEKIDEIETRSQEYSSQLKELGEMHSQSKEKMESLMEVERQMLGKMKGLTKERDELYKEIVETENKIDTLSTKIETSLDLVSRAKSRVPILEEALAEVVIDAEGVKIDEKNIPSLDELKIKIKSIEQKMESLQPVNMRALEDYERQDERKQKLEGDISRLKEQRHNLIKLAQEIKNRKNEVFQSVYEILNKNFKESYAELSEGGEAELALQNPENPFEGGLIIRAKPKGKKTLHLNALSGGEKSIASLAFIFALQAYDPSPFYVLDEVDMFLDGKNAERVAQTIKDRSKNAQFIVVSLRRVTIEKVNHIYGVTMQKDGISSMIGNVDLERIEELVEIK
jgi:chromosome segregation protein